MSKSAFKEWGPLTSHFDGELIGHSGEPHIRLREEETII